MERREEVERILRKKEIMEVKVVDEGSNIIGIVKVDDVMEEMKEEEREEDYRFGGMEEMEKKYMSIGLGEMMKKREGWIGIMLIGEMLKEREMKNLEEEMEKEMVIKMLIKIIMY